MVTNPAVRRGTAPNQSYNSQRRINRQQYRQWLSQRLQWMGPTLPISSGSAYKVQVSVAQRRHSPPHFLQPMSRSRTNFFKTYILRDRPDNPPARLDNFSTDSRQLGLFIWNVETCIGVGNYTQFQEILLTLPKGIYCLQETKATHADVLKLSHVHKCLSGTNDDPHAGVGFAIPTPLLPVVYDFHPWNSRIAVLIHNTRPHRLALFTVYAPSTVQDQRLDLQRKHEFWGHLVHPCSYGGLQYPTLSQSNLWIGITHRSIHFFLYH